MNSNLTLTLLTVAFWIVLMSSAFAQDPNSNDSESKLPRLGDRLTDEQVSRFAKLALDGIHQEYPNKPSNVMAEASHVQSPQEMHPAFYGCFDWHSSVHGHWMLVRMLRLFPQCTIGPEIRAALAKNLTKENLEVEAEYYRQKHNRSFERMYGWAWLLRLALELEEWDDKQGNTWRENIRPLEKEIVDKTLGYLPRLSYPIRTGVHPDSGFALGQVLDYARGVKNADLEKLIIERSRDYYLTDKNYPDSYEPSGEDFFSSGLNEADLMRRIVGKEEFAKWLDGFLPDLADGSSNLFKPAEVSDVTDGKIVHLAGLDLSRGWCFQGIASALPKSDKRIAFLRKAADDHALAGYKYVFSGHYEGEHWLATFAIYLHTQVGVQAQSKR